MEKELLKLKKELLKQAEMCQQRKRAAEKRDSWEYGYNQGANDSIVMIANSINEILKNGTNFHFNSVPQIWDDYKVLFVFSDDGRVSCRLNFYNDTPQDAIVSDLYVHESMRKQGGATAILNWCYECAKDRGCNSVSLRSDKDDWTREWYKRLGFEVESSQVWLKKEI